MIKTENQEQLKDCSGIRNKIKGFGQGFWNNKKIVQELGTKIMDQDRDLRTIKRLFRNQEQD